ncbi:MULTISPECIES: hypothetical protein [Acinetobacter]|jgi:uncharacterized lipoprotein YehR (DUF1307 family)|uniref:Lipoprotein n=1 Tax=Acinetobacter junii CIP 107470 = MTCC 11364 TaxID=1217666 RepID=S7YE33_ACIJU|nr:MULTISPECIES: hypothetical protein [Acinetobacter]ELA7630785.1 hypothetical protein [Acinetobacter baumannii]ENV52429.1 hypothetical protein F953_00138 [Acinetobacter junii CIP 107470 = MTCC 11364]EPR86268.1 hypothetical protein L292_2724 [Acinetobacter junii CIP 107470 = MTCC 11364]MBC6676416.1 hypothetical protein [Acinetobacter sp.]MBF6806608.1 hypothetical protein [Acinetobacter baumannii]
MKYLNILISGILIFSLAGCGKKDEKTQEDWKKRNTSDLDLDNAKGKGF